MSFRYLIAIVSLNGYTWNFRVYENDWARPVMLIFAILMFFVITIDEDYFPTKFDNYLAVHEEPERLT